MPSTAARARSRRSSRWPAAGPRRAGSSNKHRRIPSNEWRDGQPRGGQSVKATPSRRRLYLAALAAIAALVAATAAFGATTHRTAGTTLVVDNSFTLKTSDPQRAFDPTGSIIDRAIYDTLFTYNKNDLAHPVPLLVASWKASNGAKTFTFNLKKNVHFANGDPLTSADVVFSLNRLINVKGNPAFLLADDTIKAKGKYGVVVTSTTPATQLPSILANPSTGIVNSKLVKAHGGTSAADASTADQA